LLAPSAAEHQPPRLGTRNRTGHCRRHAPRDLCIFERYARQHRRHCQCFVGRTWSRPFYKNCVGSRDSSCGKRMTNEDFNLDAPQEKNMKLSQTYRAALIAIAGFLLTTVLHTGAAAVAILLSAPLAAGVTPDPASFHTQMVPTNGPSLYVRVGGKGPAVVLLHGFGFTGDMW